MPTFISILLLLLLLSCAPKHLSCAHPIVTHSRRILHQPFFPLDSIPPTVPPSPSPPQPQNQNIPFSPTTPNQQPFFPSYPSPPPPPSPTTFASFPANISSLILPQTSKPKPSSQKLVIVAVAAVVSAVLVAVIIVFFYCRRWRSRSSFGDDKTFRSDNSHRLFPANAETTNGSRKLRATSATSSEFLYLGTLVNSGGIDAGASNIGGVSPPSRKLDSPELHPLPPLARQTFSQNYGNADVGSGGDEEEEEEEEFYSPRGSLGGTGSVGTGSGSRRVFAAMSTDNFESRGSDSASSSYLSSTSGSPTRSISISISPPVSLSPRSLKLKSLESIAIQALPPPPPPPPPPPLRPPHFVTPLAIMAKPPSPLTPSSSPERGLAESPHSSPRISNVSVQNQQSLLTISSAFQQPAPVSLPPSHPPPPPPPPPPSRHWETPIASPPVCQTISKPPVLITPSRPTAFQNATTISPLELPSNYEVVEKNEEATPKPKLKPLHWDKVRASSDHKMVWDQLRSSSFK